MSAARPQRDPSLGAGILGARRDPDAPKPGASTARRSAPIRLTVDLDPPLHADLRTWAASVAGELDVPRVVLADVVRVLIRLLAEDPRLNSEAIDQLRDLYKS